MRVVLVNYGGAIARQDTPNAVLDRFRTLTGWAEGLREAGAEVVVFQAFHGDAEVERGGVTYCLIASPSMAGRKRRFAVPRRLHREVAALRPDVVHVNSLLYSIQVRCLRRRLPSSAVLVVQHHAEAPPRRILRPFDRWALSAADGFFFNGRETAAPWCDTGLIDPRSVYEIAEGSSGFRPADRRRSRDRTGLRGNPVCLWAAHLDANKDPLTVLRGLEPVLGEVPELRLYMAFQNAPLRPAVERLLASRPRLREAVELLGPMPYEKLESYFNSADIFLQGSHREGSGYALLDAMACGVIPVVTSIPSFRFLAGTEAGALWTPGDPAALTRALRQVLARPRGQERAKVEQRFASRLSFPAIGRQALEAYAEMQ